MPTEAQISESAPPPELLDVVENLAHFHGEHEQFYAQAPLRQAVQIQAASRTLRALAERWDEVQISDSSLPNPFAAGEDLNDPAVVRETGVLFMEGSGEPVEIQRLKRDLATTVADCQATGTWLSQAMMSAWESAAALIQFPALADLLGERHRIVANDWQAAEMSALAGRLLDRALAVLGAVDFSPKAVRADLAVSRVSPRYLYSAAEMADRAADLLAQSATLVHDSERRWRTVRQRARSLRGDYGESNRWKGATWPIDR